MATTQKVRDEKLKQKYLALVQEFLEGQDEEVLQVKSNEIAIPVVDDEGNERFIVMTIKVPTGERKTGEAYDGYSMAEDYQMKQTEKKVKAEAKAEKAAKDKAKREKAKAEAEAEAK